MEDALFSDDIFSQDVCDITEEADNLNEETFGLCDDYLENNGDWEKQHAAISKLIEVDAKRLKSPLKHNSIEVETSTSPFLLYDGGGHERHLSISDAEEEIIENTISSLGLDDDVHYQVKTNTPTQSIAFEESHLSWTSPTRGKEHRSDSLQELISPGGVWASPSRDGDLLWASPGREAEGVWKSPSREGENVWMSPSKDSEDVWPSPTREKLIGENTQENAETNYNGNILQKLILRPDDKFDVSSISPSLASTPPSVRNISTPSGIIPSAIRVEDLERELIKEKPKTPQPTIIERHSVSSPNIVDRHIPYPMLSPKELHMKNLLTGLGHSALDINRMASLAMVNPQLMDVGNPPQMIQRVTPTRPQSLRPYYLNPVVFGNTDMYQQQLNYHHKNWRSRTQHNENNNFTKGPQQKHDWHKELHPEKFKEIDYEEFIQMGPSKMMNVKEKKWIFKISLMSLLGGDPNSSDYYFISLIAKKDLDESEIKPEDKEIRKNLEKTSQLVNYAQQQQQTKESHKPVKFKGSLGKLSITSVHHPRQIMDFSTPDETKHTIPSEDGGKKKFILYSAVEKMYSCLLSIMDIERELGENKEQEDLQKFRIEKINEFFYMFKIKLWNSQIYSDTIHFGNLMSISKGRKLFIRVFLLFNQEQSESLFISLINILPSLLKKDKEQSMLHFNEKLQVMLAKSKKNFKLKCIKLLRKIDLKTLLIYSASILMLATMLQSLEEKDPILEWSYYVEEIPKTLLTIPDEVLIKVKSQLDLLLAMLGID